MRVCAGWGLLTVILAELVVGRSELVAWLAPASDPGILRSNERLVVDPNPRPQILVFGTSRGRGAFLPTVIETELGLERGAVLNLSMGGASIYDALLMYERNRARLSRAKIMVLQVDAFQFSDGLPTPLRFRRYASWTERMAYGHDRLRLARDYVIRTAALLPTLAVITQAVLRDQPILKNLTTDRFGRLGVVSIANDHPEEQFTPEELAYRINLLFGDYHYARFLEGEAHELITMAREDGMRVFLVRMPTVPKAHEILLADPADPVRLFHDRLEHVFSEWVDGLVYWTAPDEVGLTEMDYRDWGHLNTGGAVKFSRRFAAWLTSETAEVGT